MVYNGGALQSNQTNQNANQVYYDQATGTYRNATGQQINPPPGKDNGKQPIFMPDVSQSFNQASSGLDRYNQSLQDPGKVGSLTQGLKDVGAYQAYDWQKPEYDTSGLTAPDMERTTYDTPQIDQLSQVDPVAEAAYNAQKSMSRESIGKQFDDTRTRMTDELARTRSRPEQAAALLATLGNDQARAQQMAEQEIGFKQAQEKVGIAQQEQQLGLNRSTSLAGLNQEAQAKQAAERQQHAAFLQSQYDTGLGESKYKTGLNQAFQEEQAGEAEKAYQSKYGLAQDVAQGKLQEFETNRGAKTDYQNALLQGQQAATQKAGQESTYVTNLTEDERNAARKQPANMPSSQGPSNVTNNRPPMYATKAPAPQAPATNRQAAAGGLLAQQKTTVPAFKTPVPSTKPQAQPKPVQYR